MIDDFNREGLNIEVNFSIPSARVVRSLGRSLIGVADLISSVVIIVLSISVNR